MCKVTACESFLHKELVCASASFPSFRSVRAACTSVQKMCFERPSSERSIFAFGGLGILCQICNVFPPLYPLFLCAGVFFFSYPSLRISSLFQILIPISLYVSIELVKLGQVFLIHNDIDLYDEEADLPIQCRALNITEDLGQIQYIFSDKTGTLTENKMVFRRCTVDGIEFSHQENGERCFFIFAFLSEQINVINLNTNI